MGYRKNRRVAQLSSCNGNEVAQFFFHFIRLANRSRNLFVQQFYVSLTQPVNGHLDGALRHPVACRHLDVGWTGPLTLQMESQILKQHSFAGGFTFVAQLVQHPGQEREYPLPLEERFRCVLVWRLFRVIDFTAGDVQGKKLLSATALLSAIVIPFIGEKIVERTQQETAELAAGTHQAFERLMLKKAEEKILGDILGIRGRMPTAPDIRINGIPVIGVQLPESARGMVGI